MLPSNEPDFAPPTVSKGSNIWAQLTESGGRLRTADYIAFALLLAFGVFQAVFVARAQDFYADDVFFADAARSIVDHGFYGINGYAETNQPPGLSAILALLCATVGCNHTICLGVMVVFGTLGFFASYELLRRQMPRIIAAALCLLLISSPAYFTLVTQLVCPSFPYFFTTISALLAAWRLERATTLGSRVLWGTLLTALIAASLLLASVTVALVVASIASVCVGFLLNRNLGLTRLKIYLPVILVAIMLQGVWTHPPKGADASSGISAQEWPVSGFPQSYLSQLKVKSGNYPELGMATLSDVAMRIIKNAYQRSNFLSQMVLGRSIFVAWMSVATIGTLLVVALGWLASVLRRGGGIQEWYFAGYEAIYLLWPWALEARFFVPIAPLACLYLWRGGEVLVLLAKDRPRLLGIVWFPSAIFLAASAWLWMHGLGFARTMQNAGMQDEVSFVVWSLSAIMAAWMALAGSGWLTPAIQRLRAFSGWIESLGLRPMRALQYLGMLAIAGFLAKGIVTQIHLARTNLAAGSVVNRVSPDAEAGEWLRAHTGTDAVVMARHVPTVYHFAERKLIWFPPSSNPRLLMEGILKHKIDYVVVVKRDNYYYLPPDEECFAALTNTYPDMFRLAYETTALKIFHVVAKPRLLAQT